MANRLVIATPLYPPEPGGPATYARLLELELPACGISPVLVKWGEVKRYPKVVRHLAYSARVWRAARKADAVLALDPVSVGLPAFLAARLARKPFHVKVVGDYAWEQGVQRFGITDSLDDFVRRSRLPLPVRLLRAVELWVARGARTVIVPSSYLKRIVEAWGIEPERVEVVHNAIELEDGGVIPEALAALPRPKVLTVGRLVPWKHVDGVIAAVAQSGVPASLAVVGDGPERGTLEAVARKLLSGTLFTGRLGHADTLAAISDADALVLNSSYEGLSHLLIEALMLGTPIVATDAGGNPELIRDGENGLLVPAGDTGALAEALARMLGDTLLRSQLAAGAKADAARFSPGTMAARTAHILFA